MGWEIRRLYGGISQGFWIPLCPQFMEFRAALRPNSCHGGWSPKPGEFQGPSGDNSGGQFSFLCDIPRRPDFAPPYGSSYTSQGEAFIGYKCPLPIGGFLPLKVWI